jgi:hypothetical protein
VSKGLLANGRGRLLVVVASVAVSAAMLYDQGGNGDSPAELSVGRVLAPSGAPLADSPAGPDLIAASAPVANQSASFALPVGRAPEDGLQVHTVWVARAISVMFPEITTIGGVRQDPLKWHPNGLAIDVMIPNHNSDKGIELGNQIAGLALANAKRWGVVHVIWRQGFYPGIGAPSWTADYGNETANHFDHVHIATDGGGYPTGQETYFISSMSPAPPN